MRPTALLTLLLLGSSGQAAQVTPPTEIVQQLQARWIVSSEYTLAVAQQMPADKYAFRPTPAQMTFREQLLHIADQNQSIFREMLGLEPSIERHHTP